MAYKTDSELAAEALFTFVTNATTPYSITKDEVYQMVQDLIDSKANNNAVAGTDVATVSTAGTTITLDMATKPSRIFLGSASFGAPKTISITNVSVALMLQFRFTITTLDYLQFASSIKMSDARWDQPTLRWTPQDTGTYKVVGLYDGTNWFLDITGPYI